MKTVRDGRYSSENERKSERLVELLDSVDENFVDETYSIDSAEKLKERMRAEAPERRAKILRSPYFRRCMTAAACFVLVFGVLLGGVGLLEKLVNPTKEPTITDNRYPPVSLPSIENLGGDAITSLDMLNYYSAMKALGNGGSANVAKTSDGRTLLSAGGDVSDDVVPLPEVKDETDENLVYYYELDKGEVFTVTKAIYFQIELTDENGFLASKVGTGTVDVVITENSLEPMITFRNGERYYSCLLNTIENPEEEITNYVFSTHKYIEGFCIVKNLEQENYGFKISFDELGQAMSFACDSYKNGGTMPDGAIEILTQTLSQYIDMDFTIEQLERYFGLGDFSEIVDEILIPSEGLQFTLSDDGKSYHLTGIGECTDSHIIIPSEYEGLPVTSIKANAFENCNTITSITVPGSIKTIGDRAFKNCAALSAVVLQDGVEAIEAGAFYNCDALTNVTFGNGLKWIKERAFNDCSALREIVLPDSVTSLAYKSFAYCQSLEKIVLSDSLSFVASYTFYNCKSLWSIDIPDKVSSIGDYAFAGCESLWDINFGEQVEYIYEYAFSGCISLKEVAIPSSVSKIEKGAFAGCTKIENIHIPDGVSNIKYDLFKSCEGLTSVYIPATVEMIMRDAFSDTVNLRTIEYDGTIKQWYKIDKDSGWNTNSADYIVYCTDGIITKSGEEIREGFVFMLNEDRQSYYVSKFLEGESMPTEVVIPSEYNGLPVTGIGHYAFADCVGMKNIIIPDSVTKIEDGAFYRCSSLESVVFSKKLEAIYYGAFENCEKLKELELPDGLVTIGDSAFLHCIALENVTIPKSVVRIENYAFWDCKGLKTVNILSNKTLLGRNMFNSCSALATINYNGTIEDFKKANYSGVLGENSGEYTVYCTDGVITKSGETFPIESEDLEFQITQCVEGYDFSEYWNFPGFGVVQYYGKGYKYGDKYYVCYDVTAYPDYADGGKYVTRIEITDPAISIYGLTVNSTFEEFQKVFSAMGYTISYISKNTINAEKDGISISFTISDARIMTIRAEVTNRDGIIF